MRKLFLALGAAGALWSGQAAAVTVDNFDIPYVFGSYIYEIPDSARNSQDGNGFNAGGGWPLTEHGAVEFNFFDFKRTRNIDGLSDYQKGVLFNYVYDFGTFGFSQDWLPNFKPYVLGGPGWVHEDVQGSKHNHIGADAGVGTLIPLHFGSWDWGWSARTEFDVLAQWDHPQAVSGHDFLLDYHFLVGLQIPLTPLFKPHQAAAPTEPQCKVEVVDPVTGRKDCATDVNGNGIPGNIRDADGDGVPDEMDQCPGTPPHAKVDVNGCMVNQTLVLDEVDFELNSAVLTATASRILDSVAAGLNGQKNVKIEIDGYTDSTGTAAYNMTLSQQRAEAVRQYLIGKGIDSARMTTQGFGDTKPLDSNKSEPGRAANRRVELKITAQ